MTAIRRSELPDLTPEQVADALYHATPAMISLRSRKDPAALRVIKSFRLRPDTAEAIADESKRSGLSQGQVIDLLAKDINK